MTEYPYHDEDWLLDALGEQTVEEIAAECDVTADTIERWIDKHGIVHEQEEPVEDDDSDSTATAVDTASAAEGEPAPRTNVTTDDVETGDGDVTYASTEHDFPEEIETLGVGDCQNCGTHTMLGSHPIQGTETVSVCARCDEYLRGNTINTKETIIENPTVPHWSENNE